MGSLKALEVWCQLSPTEYSCELCRARVEGDRPSKGKERGIGSLRQVVTWHSPEALLHHLLDHRIEDVPELAAELTPSVLAPLEQLVMSGHSYDEQCLVLAKHFLDDYESGVSEDRPSKYDRSCLAEYVQEAVETWLRDQGFGP